MFAAFLNFLTQLLALDRWMKRAMVIGVDGLLCVGSIWLAFSIRFGVWLLPQFPVATFIIVALLTWLPVFYLCGVYRVLFRYAGAGTIFDLGKAVLIYGIPLIAIFGFWTVPGVPRTVSLLQPILFFCMLALSRIVMRYVLVDLLSMRGHGDKMKRILIYGAGNSGQQLASSFRGEGDMQLKGYIDDDMSLVGQKLNGVPVFSGQSLGKVLKDNHITDVLLAFPSASRTVRKAAVQRVSHYSVRVKTLPRLSHILDGKVSFDDLRDVSVEDLLGRSTVQPDISLMGSTITGKTIMVTGAGGSIGSELCRQILAQEPACLILAEISEVGLYLIDQELRETISRSGAKSTVRVLPELANAVDQHQMARLFRKWKPHTVFHAAAYKHVPLVEANPMSGIRNNVFGTLHTAIEAEKAGVGHFILISTDKAVRPTNVMGASKRTCELVLQALAAQGSKTRFAMVRFGNVLGSSGSVVPRFLRQIREGGPVTVTHRDITRYFMTIPEAAQLVIQAGAMAEGGEVYVLDMGESVRIIDLAESMINLSGRSVKNSNNPEGDIEITEVGLRPGEKLYEELLIGDNPEPTPHERIMKANEKMVSWDVLRQVLDNMNNALAAGDQEQAMSMLRDLVPEYTGAVLR